jgi:hypothetical protein
MSKLEINDYSQELLDLVPELKKGQTVTFELIHNSVQELLNEDNSRQRIAVFPTAKFIPNRDTIYDAWANKGKGDHIDIGYVTAAATRNSDPVFGSIQFLGVNAGRITLTADKKDLPLYRYLMLTNFNRDSVNPDKSEPTAGYVFATVKPEATAQEKLELKRLKNRASATIEILTESELLELAKYFGLNATRTEAEIKADLYDIAESEKGAKVILSREAHTVIAVNALLEDAQKLKVIAYNPDENEWNWVDTGRKIIGQQAGDATESLKRFMAETDAGEKFHDNLKKAVESSRSKKKK